jgi:4-amino-4-deoxy-L-arabinose transferase-like glycosyltransferase
MHAPTLPRDRAFALVAIVLLIAFAFLGSRGLWEPDEGRYANVALVMLDRGDWLVPMRNEITGHWTKPPMTYWLIAASVSAFGQHASAVRLPIALAFVVCVVCVGWIARHCAPGRAAKASLAFATMLAPACAAQLVTTDFPLAAAESVAMGAFVQARFGDARWRGVALLGMSAAFGVAFLIKGPPALLPLIAVAAMALLAPSSRPLSWRWYAGGVALWLAVALPWYGVVAARHDGLLAYFLGAEVLDRMATDRFARNGGPLGWAIVYGPMLVLGSLPWTVALGRWGRRVASRVRAWRDARARAADAPDVLLLAWIALPLFVFCIAQSRLPLYVLPLFVPVAVAVARVDGRWPRVGWLAAWVVALLALRLIAAHWSTPQDASAWARALAARVDDAPLRKVVFVDDTPRWGLHLHLDAQVERRTRAVIDGAPAYGRRFDGDVVASFETGAATGTVFVAPQAAWPELRTLAAAHGYVAQARGTPFEGRQVFTLRPAP